MLIEMNNRAMLIPSIFLCMILRYSKSYIPFCGYNSYYCPSRNQCYNRSVRCTPEETCDYTEYESDNCFRSETSPGAYKVFLGHVKLNPTLLQSASFQPEHQFIQYRGLTYQFGYAGTQALDVNDPIYCYGENNANWRYASRGLENVGISYCDSSEIQVYFLNHWKMCDKLFWKNCIHFAEALMLFLATGPCQAPTDIDGGYTYFYTMKKHGQDIIDYVGSSYNIFGRKRLGSSFLVQSVDTIIFVTTLLVQSGVLYILL